MNRILIIGHDLSDVIFGCGATLAKHSFRGDEIKVLIFPDDFQARIRDLNYEIDGRQGLLAMSILGVIDVESHKFSDQYSEKIQLLGLVSRIKRAKCEFKPNIVIFTNNFNVSIDGKRFNEGAFSVFRPRLGEEKSMIYVTENLPPQSLSGSESGNMFFPDTYIDVEEFLDRKIEAFKALNFGLNRGDISRFIGSICDRAKLRGSHVGLNATEALMLIFSSREIGKIYI